MTFRGCTLRRAIGICGEIAPLGPFLVAPTFDEVDSANEYAVAGGNFSNFEGNYFHNITGGTDIAAGDWILVSLGAFTRSAPARTFALSNPVANLGSLSRVYATQPFPSKGGDTRFEIWKAIATGPIVAGARGVGTRLFQAQSTIVEESTVAAITRLRDAGDVAGYLGTLKVVENLALAYLETLSAAVSPSSPDPVLYFGMHQSADGADDQLDQDPVTWTSRNFAYGGHGGAPDRGYPGVLTVSWPTAAGAAAFLRRQTNDANRTPLRIVAFGNEYA